MIILMYVILWGFGCLIIICLLAVAIEKKYKKDIQNIDKYYNDELNYRLDYVEYV